MVDSGLITVLFVITYHFDKVCVQSALFTTRLQEVDYLIQGLGITIWSILGQCLEDVSSCHNTGFYAEFITLSPEWVTAAIKCLMMVGRPESNVFKSSYLF